MKALRKINIGLKLGIAAAKSMAHQSSALRDLVSVFKLDGLLRSTASRQPEANLQIQPKKANPIERDKACNHGIPKPRPNVSSPRLTQPVTDDWQAF